MRDSTDGTEGCDFTSDLAWVPTERTHLGLSPEGQFLTPEGLGSNRPAYSHQPVNLVWHLQFQAEKEKLKKAK